MPAATPKQYGVAATLFPAPTRSRRRLPAPLGPGPQAPGPAAYAAPRWRASQTAVDSRTPSSIARPQCAIQAAIPSGVPET